MENRRGTAFDYAVFDKASQALLAHGESAVSAIEAADRLAPNTIEVCVISAGQHGQVIWNSKRTLMVAETALAMVRGAAIKLERGESHVP